MYKYTNSIQRVSQEKLNEDNKLKIVNEALRHLQAVACGARDPCRDRKTLSPLESHVLQLLSVNRKYR